MSKILSRLQSNRKGQVLIEYLLLMVITVSAASVITRAFINRQPGSEGMIIKVWDGILKTIGNDLPDCKQNSYSTPNCQP